jgi:PAS domain S-box-containing protein
VGHGALDYELRFVAVNEVLAAINGRPVEAHMGRSVAEVLPNLAPTLEPLLREVLRTGVPVEDVEIAGAPTGERDERRRWRASYYPVRTQFGAILGIEAVVRALADAGGPAAAPGLAPLRDDRSIFAQAPVGILLSDLQGRLLDCNPAFCALTGYSREELLALSTADITYPDDLAADLAAARSALGGEQAVAVVEKRYVRRDGSVIWVQVTRATLADRAGASRYGLAFVEDISTRRAIQAALAESQRRFQRIAELTPFIVSLYDVAAGVYRYTNRDLGGFLGFQPGELRAPDDPRFLALVLPDDRAVVAALPARYAALPDDAVIETVACYRHADGGRRWLRSHAVVFTRDAAGSPELILELTEDVTREADARLRLAQERARLEEVLRQLPVAVGIAEAPAGRLVLANSQLAAILRHPARTAETVAEYSAYRGFHPDGRPYAPEEWPLARALLAGESIQGELIAMERGDGTLGTIEASAGPVRNPDGQIVAAVVTFSDVSARVAAEERQHALAAASEALTTSLDLPAMLQSVAAALVERYADGCSLAVYPTATLPPLLAVRHRDDAVTAQLAAIAREHAIAPEAMERLLATLIGPAPSRLKRDIAPPPPDAPLSTADREVYRLLAPHSGIVVRLLARGLPMGLLTLTRSDPRRPFDEVDQEFAEELARRCALAVENARLYADERQARAEAELSVRLRDEFLAVASHELRSPLSALTGQVQLLIRRDEREGQLSERDRATIRATYEQARRLDRMMSELLDATRIATGRLELTPATVDLAAIVREVVEALRPAAPQHQLSLDLPDGAVLLQGDELRLTQVVSNLLQNAVKYSPAGGPVRVGLSRGQGQATLAVRDRGIGIPAAALPRLFERYYRAPNAGAARIGGMGIGLYLVKELVELHGGTIAVSSAEGEGSTFTVTLPLGA